VHCSYDFGLTVLELILKYIGTPGHGLQLPALPPPVDRLKQISFALRNTRVDDSASTGTKTRNSIQRGDEVHARYFRCKTVSREIENAVEDDVMRRSASSDEDDDIHSHFDDVTVRSLRALLCSTDEWRLLFPGPSTTAEEEVTLERLGPPRSVETERLVAAALAMILRMELEDKPTTLVDDVSLLAALQASLSASSGATGGQEVDPSGGFSVADVSILKFRIEKKLLLQEGISISSSFQHR